MRNKAERIHHNERIRNKTRQLQSHMKKPISGCEQKWYDREHNLHTGFDTWEDVNAWNEMNTKKLMNNRVDCSCAACGNPRKWFGRKTRQENISMESMKAQLVD